MEFLADFLTNLVGLAGSTLATPINIRHDVTIETSGAKSSI
jgi:hypothetical protein